MATAEQRYAEKIAARASGRTPVFQQQPLAAREGASVHERYLAKLAARATGAKGQSAPAGAEPKREPAPEPKREAPDAKPLSDVTKGAEPKREPKAPTK